MKILTIIGSPRKGNCYKITNMLEERMKTLGDVEMEYLFLRDYDLSKCTGCHLCIMKGEELCPAKMDFLSIEKKMMEADGVILASPIYTFHVTGLMKNFIDRFSYCVHRPRFFGKKAMVYVLRGGMFKESIKYVSKAVKGWGFEVTSTLGVLELDSLQPKFREKMVKQINSSADKFFNSFKNTRIPKPSLNDLIGFRIWRLNAEVCKDSIPKDFIYWTEKGWFNMPYYYDSGSSWIKVKLADLISKLARVFMRKMFIGY